MIQLLTKQNECRLKDVHHYAINQPNLTADTVNIDDDQFVENVGYALKK